MFFEEREGGYGGVEQAPFTGNFPQKIVLENSIKLKPISPLPSLKSQPIILSLVKSPKAVKPLSLGFQPVCVTVIFTVESNAFFHQGFFKLLKFTRKQQLDLYLLNYFKYFSKSCFKIS